MNPKTLLSSFPFILLIITVMLSACSKKIVKVIEKNEQLPHNQTIHNYPEIKHNTVPVDNPDEQSEPISDKPAPNPDPLLQAEEEASVAGKEILEIGRKMVFDEKAIVSGSCWDYINEVFIRAGYKTNKHIVFKSEKQGPYVDVSEIKPGDWIYHINYSYHGIEHSGIFVYWKDYENKIGVTLSYGGEKRNEPGRYRAYDLKSVYYITRPGLK